MLIQSLAEEPWELKVKKKKKNQQDPQSGREQIETHDGSLNVRAKGWGDSLVFKALAMQNKCEGQSSDPHKPAKC